MIDTITTHASKAPASPDAAVAAPGFRMRWWMDGLILVLSLSSVLGGALYSYLRFGWFESDVLGQTLQLKCIHQEGLSYHPKRPWGFFPRAEGLLREPFTDNAWSITSADGHRLYHRPATWWAVPLKKIPKHVRAAFMFQEDQRFEQHAGVDPRALVRAMAKTLTGKRQCGGRDGVPSGPSRSALDTRGQNRHARWRARCLIGRLSPDSAANASDPDPSTDHIRCVGRL